MKTGINKSAKRALSLLIAVAMLIGSLFTANVGITINAGAETTETAVEKTISYWDGSVDSSIDSLKDAGEAGTSWDTAIIIDDAKELATLVAKTSATNTRGLYFKISDKLEAIVLQSKTHGDVIKGYTSSTDVKTYVEANASSLYNWSYKTNPNSIFNGNLDGNGVPIYGLYADSYTYNGTSSQDNAGLFAFVDGGGTGAGTSSATAESDPTGITFKNIVIKNSYYKSPRRIGGIAACAYGSGGAAFTNGTINFNGCEVTNCYMEETGKKITGAADNNTNCAGVIIGDVSTDRAVLNNCLVYDITTSYANAEDPIEIAGTTGSIKEDGAIKHYFSISNTVSIGIIPHGNDKTASCFSNVYTDQTTTVSTIVNIGSADAAKGMVGRLNMGGLNWADAAVDPDDGDTYWYVRENDYPTLFRPADDYWKSVEIPSIWGGSVASEFASYPDGSKGDGSKEKPFLIKTAEQLYRALSTTTHTFEVTTNKYDSTTKAYTNEPSVSTVSVAGGMQTSEIKSQEYDKTTPTQTSGRMVPVYTPYYYKVADGVEAIYLNNIYDKESLSGIKELVESGSAKTWAPGKTFVGNLDGNGVTIYGMYSSNGTGFVYKLDGSATVKNFNFDSCYSAGTGNVAMITTNIGSYINDTTIHTVANISVRNSYIKTTKVVSITENSGVYSHGQGAAGLISTSGTSEDLIISNCLFDAHSCEVVQGAGSVGKIGGIISGGSGMNNVSIYNSVSLGAPLVDEVYESGKMINYSRYDKNQGFQVFFRNSYSDVTTEITTQYAGKFDKLTDITRIESKDAYAKTELPMLDWNNIWTLATYGDRTIPMLKGSASENAGQSYSDLIANSGRGANFGRPYADGTFGLYYDLIGAGTAADPYIITNALELARAIASGGKNLNDILYYKLSCDIDLSGSSWITQDSIANNYTYVEFSGTLDGAGHTITGLSATDDQAVGLIPVLNGGTVKNLHIRNSYAGSADTAGIIAGKVTDGKIIGCSVESSTAIATNGTDTITGNGTVTIDDSYYVVDNTQTCYIDNAVATPTVFYPAENAVWYKGADGIARLVNFAKAHSVTDIDADGVINERYYPTDLVALRNFLLEEKGYANIYGDVNNDGTTNIRDLAVIRSEMVGTYNDIKDGFWRNLELNTVKIYYAENDTQDMARKMELYLESVVEGLDIVKVAGTAVTDGTIPNSEKEDYANQNNAIVIKQETPTPTTYMNYSVDYEASTNVLTINGGSFTAVEQAVLDFIEKATLEANPTDFTGSILDAERFSAKGYVQDKSGTAKTTDDLYKAYRHIDVDSDGVLDEGEAYYYAWGDEFESGTTYNADNWNLVEYRFEDDDKDGNTIETGNYLNLESANLDSIDELWAVNNGRLTINRGIRSDYEDSYPGYVPVELEVDTTNDFGSYIDKDDIYIDPGLIKTVGTMLFKYGYAEMRASLPSDGHAFPAWWILTGPSLNNNKQIDSTLYDKVYYTNPYYDGVTDRAVGTDLDTYKYQIPAAHLEFDIVELMQSQTGATSGVYKDYFQATVHKIYTENVNENLLYIPDWSTYLTTKASDASATVAGKLYDTYTSDGAYATKLSEIGTTGANFFKSANNKPYLNNYNLENFNSKYAYSTKSITGTSTVSASFSMAAVAGKLQNNWWDSAPDEMEHHYQLQRTYTYGFTWTADPDASTPTYNLAIYCDLNADGVMTASSEKIFEITQDVGYDTDQFGDDPTVLNGTDADMWNQYAYILLDNAFYTSSSGAQYGDLTIDSSKNDKVTFDIEYVRVYQRDGERDIVTPETESFNNGNHFGY